MIARIFEEGWMRQGLASGCAAQARFGVRGELGRRKLTWWGRYCEVKMGFDSTQQKMRDFRPKGQIDGGQ